MNCWKPKLNAYEVAAVAMIDLEEEAGGCLHGGPVMTISFFYALVGALKTTGRGHGSVCFTLLQPSRHFHRCLPNFHASLDQESKSLPQWETYQTPVGHNKHHIDARQRTVPHVSRATFGRATALTAG